MFLPLRVRMTLRRICARFSICSNARIAAFRKGFMGADKSPFFRDRFRRRNIIVQHQCMGVSHGHGAEFQASPQGDARWYKPSCQVRASVAGWRAQNPGTPISTSNSPSWQDFSLIHAGWAFQAEFLISDLIVDTQIQPNAARAVATLTGTAAVGIPDFIAGNTFSFSCASLSTRIWSHPMPRCGGPRSSPPVEHSIQNSDGADRAARNRFPRRAACEKRERHSGPAISRSCRKRSSGGRSVFRPSDYRSGRQARSCSLISPGV